MSGQQRELFDTDPAPWDLDAAADVVVATIVFPEAPRGEFDYVVPDVLLDRLRAGARVRVPLGKGNRSVVGYCTALGNPTRPVARLKEVLEVIDEPPLISPDILDLTKWMADYYLCDLGKSLEAVVPTSVRGKAGTRATTFVRVSNKVAARLSELDLPAKQLAAITALIASGREMTIAELCRAAACSTTGPIKSLVRKQLIQSESRRVYQGDPEAHPVEPSQAPDLNSDQIKSLGVIRAAMDSGKHQTILLHGVTGSGKTEVYIQAIEHVIGFGRQAIVLVPEISLTPQTRRRFRSRFDRVAVLHSHLSPPQRHGEWLRIVRGEVQVVVGARSAIFAPLPHLGLIVIDEEHEPSYKQDSIPRYHVRDVAARRAAASNIPLVLGSATPSLESFHRAQNGQYQLAEMPHRVLGRPMPMVSTIDLRNEENRRGVRGSLSRPLRQAMKVALADDGQIILLLNRRGYSTHIQCPACGVVVRCKHCDIALTHHRNGEKAVCHYCDFQMPTPRVCPDCGFAGIRFGGLGTQRLEAEVKAAFPDAACLRMDTDTMKRHGSHEKALARFRDGEIRILLGTQMIAKGLDFPNVTLVGVVNADVGLHLPDFRAAERTFQLVTQVAGRTGRGEKGGRVMVQTYSPADRAIQAAVRHDFAAFAAAELPEREAFHYPPFTSVIRVVFRGATQATTEAFAEQVGSALMAQLQIAEVSARTLGPVAAPIAKLRGKYRYHMLILTTNRAALCDVFRQVSNRLQTPPDLQWIVDADAISML